MSHVCLFCGALDRRNRMLPSRFPGSEWTVDEEDEERQASKEKRRRRKEED